MDRAFLLQHQQPEDDEPKIIGIYSSDDEARAAIERVKQKPGFRDQPDWFTIEPYDLDADHWLDGFIPPTRKEIPAWGCLAVIVLPATLIYGAYSGNWAALAFVLACGGYMLGVGVLAKRKADKIDYSAR